MKQALVALIVTLTGVFSETLQGATPFDYLLALLQRETQQTKASAQLSVPRRP
jgi:hypothetical protein